MRNTLADETLDDPKRKAMIAQLAEQAEQDLKAAIAEARRAATLKRVLDPALVMLLETRPDVAEPPDDRVRVTVLVSNVDKKTTGALRKAGLAIEAASKSLPIVVGTTLADDLKTLALVEGVRRIEPTRMTPG